MVDMQQWNVQYIIRSGMDGYRAVMADGSCTVTATEETAEGVALEYIHDHDVRTDPRVDPQVIILDIDLVDDTDE
jgi:hypothetical protein